MKPSSTKIDDQLATLVSESDPAEKLQGAKSALLDSLEIDYGLGVAASHVLRGSALWQMSQFAEAISALDKATLQLASHPNCHWHARLHLVYGHVYRELGVFEQALEHYLATLKIAKEIQDETLVMRAEGSLGNVSVSLGDYERGIASYLSVLQLAKGEAHQLLRFSAYINLAAAYHYAEDHRSAVDAAQNALALTTSAGELLKAHGNLGVAYTGLGDFEKARYHLERSLEVARESSFILEQCVCNVDLADYYIKIGEDDSAIHLLFEGLELAQAIDFKLGIRDCHQRLHTLFRKQQSWELALFHLEQLHSVEKAMFNDSSDARIRNLDALYKVEQLRDANERQRREFDALTQMRNALLSDLSHDLKNPLSALILSFALLRKLNARIPSEHQQRFNKLYDDSEVQVRRMIRLINDVLDMASYDVGAGINLQRTNVSELIGEVCSGFQEQASAKKITLQCHYEGVLHILADASAIHRVLENLVSNAIKYTRDGGHIKLEASRSDEHNSIIRIKDDGVGIPEDQLPRIFERFYRIPSHTGMAEGTGLGMAIVKSIVDKHNGSIKVESAVDHGTTVTITLPAS